MSETALQSATRVPSVIVSRPGIMQQSLRASLAACPGIEIVGTYGDGLTALNAIAEHAPALLVIDFNLLDEEIEALLAAVKLRYAATHCVVLIRSGQRAAWARASGADAVVPHDGSMHELMAVLARFRVNPL